MYITHGTIRLSSEEVRVTAAGSICRKFREVWACDFCFALEKAAKHSLEHMDSINKLDLYGHERVRIFDINCKLTWTAVGAVAYIQPCCCSSFIMAPCIRAYCKMYLMSE